MSKYKNKKKTVMTKFKITEISAVDRPAQSPALMTIMKRADDDEELLNKRGILTTDNNGHSHLIYDMEEDSGHTSYAGDGPDNHSHPWMRNDNGEIVIGEASGHTHKVRSLLITKAELPDQLAVDEFVKELEDRGTVFEKAEYQGKQVTLDKPFRTPKEKKKFAVYVKDGDKVKIVRFGSSEMEIRRDNPKARASFRARHKCDTQKDKTSAAYWSCRMWAKGESVSDMLSKGISPPGADISMGDGPPTKSKPAAKSGKNTKESPMTDKVKKSAEELAAELETTRADLAKTKVLAEFTDVEKVHYNSLNDTQKEAFIAKSADDRKAEVEAAQEEDAVVYKSDDGEEFRKSDDPRLVKMAKQADKDRKERQEAIEKAANAEFAKRAGTELQHLPGEEAAKVAILKAVDGIKDEDLKKQATELLKANNEAMAEAFKKKGSSGNGADSSADDQLTVLAKKYAEDNKVDFNKAYDAVLQTKEGKELYEATLTKGE